MAIQSEISQISYLGNGSAGTGYPVPFYFFEDTDLKVSRTDAAGIVTQLTHGAHYSVSGAGNPSGGSVMTTTAYGGSDRISIVRTVPATQLLVYDENDRFPAKSHERGLDRLTMLAQQLSRSGKRCLRVADSQPEIPPFDARIPNSLTGLDGDGVPKLYTIDELLTLISLPAPVLNFPVKTWADDGGRNAAVPDFVGQPGTQQNTKTLYIATGLSAGNWVLAPASIAPGAIGKLQLGALAAAANLPIGAVIQSVSAKYTEGTEFSGTIPYDNSKPQIGEGNAIASVPITPSFSNSKFRIRATVPASINGNTDALILAVFRGGLDDAIGATFVRATDDYDCRVLVLECEDSPATVSPLTYSIRMGVESGGGAYYVNGTNSTAKLGGSCVATLVVEEIKQLTIDP